MPPWLHYSYQPVTFNEVKDPACSFRNKPVGLYFAKGEAWKEWCEANQFPCPQTFRYHLHNADELKLINQDQVWNYCIQAPESMLMDAYAFDWNRMKADGYQGFILERENWSADCDVTPRELWHWDFDVDTVVVWGGGQPWPRITPAPVTRTRRGPSPVRHAGCPTYAGSRPHGHRSAHQG